MISEFIQTNPWIICIIHIALAVLLFFIVNWIGKNSVSVGYQQLSVVYEEGTSPAFNFIFKVLAPVVYLVLCATFFQSIHIEILINRCYLIVVYYWAFRFVWNLIANRWKLLDFIQLSIYWIVSISISLWIYKNIKNVENLLPSGDALLGEMWLLIIAFLYTVFNKMNIGVARSRARKDAYIKSRYEKLKSEYDNIIHPFFNNSFYEVLSYSIMIYEDFNRPYMIRKVEYLKFYITRKPHTLGIMQVTTDRFITDKESVRLAITKIAHDNNQFIREKIESLEEGEELNIFRYELISYIADKYNGGDPNYSGEIYTIFSKIAELVYNNEIPDSYYPL